MAAAGLHGIWTTYGGPYGAGKRIPSFSLNLAMSTRSVDGRTHPIQGSNRMTEIHKGSAINGTNLVNVWQPSGGTLHVYYFARLGGHVELSHPSSEKEHRSVDDSVHRIRLSDFITTPPIPGEAMGPPSGFARNKSLGDGSDFSGDRFPGTRMKLTRLSGILLVVLFGIVHAHAEAALLLEEPFGEFGHVNPTGHAAVYLTRICAASPTRLRRCEPGESGVVISRYHKIAGYDWIAIPLVPYLYAVEDPADIPKFADAKTVAALRDEYRRAHLSMLAPDDSQGLTPGGEWIQLIGSSYDRKIYGFEIETSPSQDDRFIRTFNARSNRSHFNLFFHNCADFARAVLDFYYPGAVHRAIIADAGITTPKQLAKTLLAFSRQHESLEFTPFVIPQAAGSVPRSSHVDGVLEALVKSKKYVVPLAILHPVFAGTLAAAYLSRGRFDPGRDVEVFDAAHGVWPPSLLGPGQSDVRSPDEDDRTGKPPGSLVPRLRTKWETQTAIQQQGS